MGTQWQQHCYRCVESGTFVRKEGCARSRGGGGVCGGGGYFRPDGCDTVAAALLQVCWEWRV
jgi:hypothetical protein